MIRYQNPGMSPPARSFTHLTKRGEKGFPVVLVAKDWFAPVSPIEEMIDGTCEFHSGLPGHEPG